jgi:hypothetical protein
MHYPDTCIERAGLWPFQVSFSSYFEDQTDLNGMENDWNQTNRVSRKFYVYVCHRYCWRKESIRRDPQISRGVKRLMPEVQNTLLREESPGNAYVTRSTPILVLLKIFLKIWNMS